jgi:hypothetical protein
LKIWRFENLKMKENEVIELFAKKLAQRASQEELEKLESQLQQHPDLLYVLKQIVEYEESEISNIRELEEAFERHIIRMKTRSL